MSRVSRPLLIRGNVIYLRFKTTSAQRAYLAEWVAAGQPMGIHDAGVVAGNRGDDIIHVWVRENPDPAYLVAPTGRTWTVTDNIRHRVLGRMPSLDMALNFIRPVLSADISADAD